MSRTLQTLLRFGVWSSVVGDPLEVLFIASQNPVNADDAALISLLESRLNATVTVALDSDAEQSMTGVEVIVISESSNSGNIGTKYSTVSRPVVLLENGAWDDHDYSATDGTLTATTDLVVTDDTHQIADGHTGQVSANTSGDMKFSSDYAASAHVVLNQVGTPANAIVFVYESGETMLNSHVAEDRRVALGFHSSMYQHLTTGGEDFFVSAVAWAAQVTEQEQSTTTSNILLVVGSLTLNTSEGQIKSRLEGQGHSVDTVTGANVTTTQANGYGLSIMSKTVNSGNVARKLHQSTSPCMFWEDNQQAGEDFLYMATIYDSGHSTTGWHGNSQVVIINDSAPTALKAGLTGTINLYDSSREMTFAPYSDGTGTYTAGDRLLVPGAIDVAEHNSGGSGQWSLYTVESGTTLSDGTSALARRGYFGLYDDTFQYLTSDGLALFDAMIDWLIG